MKKNIILAAVFSLFVMAIGVSAQKTTDFSGTWTLDVTKSKLGDRNNIKSQTITVTQTATDLKVDTKTERAAPPADAAAPMAGGGGRPGGMGGGMGGDGSMTYKLDGSAVKSEMQGRGGTMQVSTTAKLDGGKFAVTRTMTTPMGDRTSTETWSINADGTLSIESSRPNRDGGTDTTTKVFTKNK